jgi:hypothetical protein
MVLFCRLLEKRAQGGLGGFAGAVAVASILEPGQEPDALGAVVGHHERVKISLVNFGLVVDVVLSLEVGGGPGEQAGGGEASGELVGDQALLVYNDGLEAGEGAAIGAGTLHGVEKAAVNVASVHDALLLVVMGIL